MHRDPIREAGGHHFYSYASNDPINFIAPNGLSPVKTVGWVIKLSKKGYKLIKKVSGEEALKAVKKGENIIANSHAEARKLARKASEKKKPIRDPAHKPGEGQMPHYHPNPRSGGHIFYSIAPLLTFSHHTGGAWWGEALDFVNPLSLGQDLIEIKECLNDPL